MKHARSAKAWVGSWVGEVPRMHDVQAGNPRGIEQGAAIKEDARGKHELVLGGSPVTCRILKGAILIS